MHTLVSAVVFLSGLPEHVCMKHFLRHALLRVLHCRIREQRRDFLYSTRQENCIFDTSFSVIQKHARMMQRHEAPEIAVKAKASPML